MLKKRNLKDVIKGPAHILYHATLIALSGSVAALSLPYTADFIVTRLMIFWTFIGNEKISLISVGIALTMVLILFLNYMMLMILFNYSFNYIARSWKDRKVSRSANRAGPVRISTKGFFARGEIRRLKESNGIARDILIIGSTGFRTFVEENGDTQGDKELPGGQDYAPQPL